MSAPDTPPFTRPTLPPLPPDSTSLLIYTPLPVPAFPDPSTLSFSVLSRTPIAAPATTVLAAILDITTWPKWNTFTPHTTVHSPPTSASPSELVPSADYLGIGSRLTMRLNMYGKPKSEIGDGEALMGTREVVTVLERLDPEREGGRHGWRVAWGYDEGREWLLRAQRVQEVVETEAGCEYVTWESFGGWGAGVVRMVIGRSLVDRFKETGRDLKGWCEGEGRGGEGLEG